MRTICGLRDASNYITNRGGIDSIETPESIKEGIREIFGSNKSPNEVVAALRGRDDDVHCDGHRVETGDEVVGKVDVVVGAVECHTLRAEERR